MKEELGTILNPIELNLRWYLNDEKPADRTWVRAVFLTFSGSCGAFGLPEVSVVKHGRVGLAETAVSSGTVMPYSRMDCDRLRGLLAENQDAGPGGERRMGVAMARVVAHELYHVLLETTGHSGSGIAAAVYSPRSLLARSFRFEAGELEKIRQKYALAPRLHVASVARASLTVKDDQ